MFFPSCPPYQGQDFLLDVNDINLLEVPRPQWLREYDDIGHCNAFGWVLVQICPPPTL